MSKFVDERVVEMSFDNKKFETNVKTSMDTINKLKDSLDFSGSAKNINRHLDGVNTNSLATGLSSISQGFSTLQIMGISAIANITSRLVDMGIELVKALTGINELTAGWMKFQEVSTSEATLLAQGYEQAVVTKAIEDLLWFTDETSYSFTEMMNNMSKFTAAGVGLKEAQESMMGIANWAALSGQNAQTASRVMYQLSQAMGSGVIKLQDWKSIETANMATKEFKDMILATAESMETLTRNVDGTYTTLTGKTFEGGQFRDFLSEGFLTSDVLTKTLEAYSSVATEIQKMMADDSSLTTASKALEIYEKQIIDLENSLSSLSNEERLLTEQRIAEMKFGIKAFKAAQEARTLTDAINSVKDAVSTGWTKIFRSIFGGVDQAKKLWTDLANSLYDIFMDGMWKKIDVLDIWTELGGRDDLWENTEEATGAFWNLFNALVAIKDLVSGAWTKVFGFSQLEDYDENVSEIGHKLKNFTENLREWSAGLVMSEKTTEALTDVLTGLFSIVKIGGKLLGAFWKGIQPLVKVVSSFATILIGAFGKVGKVLTDFANTTTIFDKIANGMQKFFNTIINFVKSLNLLDGIKTFIDAFTISLKKTTGVTGDFVKNQSIFKTILNGITDAFKWLGDILSRYVLPILPKVFEVLGTGLGWIIGTISNLISCIGGLIKRFTEWASTNKTFQNGMLFLKKVLDSVGNAFKSLWTNIVGFFSSFGKVNTKPVDDFSDDVQTSLSPLQTFLEGLSNLFKGLWNVVKAFIPAIGALFTFIGKALSAIGDKLKEIFTKDNGDVNFQKIFTVGFWGLIIVGITRFADMLRSITEVFRDAFDGVFDYFNSSAMKNYMEAIKTMAISILLLVGALLILGSMDTGTLVKATIALSVLIGVIVAVMLAMKALVITNFEKTGKMIKGSTSSLAGLGFAFIGLGMAILLLATSLKMLSKLNPQEMMYSLGILAIMMVMLTTVMKVVGKTEKGTNKAVKSMVKVAISVALLARPLKRIGSIDTATGVKGLIGIAALMTILVGYSAFSKPIEKSQKPINGLMTTAIALTILIIPLKVIGKMSWQPIVTAFGAIFALFTILVLVSKVLNKKDVNSLQVVSKNLTKFAFGLALFGTAMLLVGLNSWMNVLKTITILVGVYGVLTTVSKLMKLKDANRLTTITKNLTKFAFGLALFGTAMLILGSNGWMNILKTIATLVGVFGALVATNMILGKKLTEPRIKNMTRIVRSLIPMSIGLGIFGASMRSMSKIGWDSILKSLAVLTAIFGIMSAFSILLSKTGTNTGSLIILGVSLITLSIGLMAFSGALAMLGNMKLETIGKGLLSIVAIFAVLGIAALLLKPIIPVLLMLSLTFGIFAVGVFLLVTALSTLVGIMLISSTAFAAGLIAMSAAVITAAPMIMKALWVVIKGILDIIVQAVPLVVNAITQLLLEIIKAIEIIVPPLMAMVVNLLLEILTAVQTIVPQVIDLVITLLTELLTKIQTIFPLITSTLMSLLLNVLDVLIENIPELVNKLVDLFIGLISTLRTRLPEILMELALFMADLVDGAVLAITELVPRMVNAGFDLMIGLLDGIGNTLVERAPEVREAIVNFAKNIWEAFLSFFGINSPSTKFIEVAGHMISGLIKGLWDGLTGLISEIGKWAGSIMSSIGGFFKDAWNKGKDLIKNIGDGAKSVWSGVSSWFSGTAKDIGNFFSNKASDLKQTGTNIIKNIGDGAKSAWSGVSSWFSGTAKDIGGFFSGGISTMKDVGSDLIGGLKNGLETAGNSIKETAKNVGTKVTGWFKDIFGIKSPSRVFAEIGKFLDLGLASGIENNSDVAYDAAGALADDTINGFERSGLSQVLQDLNGSLQSDFDNEIVIRPVLDLSEIQNGKNRLYNMMNDGSSYDISGSNNMARSARDEMNSRNRSEKGSENNGNVSTTGNNTEIVNNTFNITGSSPKEIAEEVSRVIQNSVDRRKAKNGNFSF